MHKKDYPGNPNFIVLEDGIVYNKHTAYKMKPSHNGKYNIQPSFSPVYLSEIFDTLQDFEYTYDLDTWSVTTTLPSHQYQATLVDNYIAVFDDNGALLRIFRTPSRKHLKMSEKTKDGIRKNINRWKINNTIYTRRKIENDYNNNN